MQDMGAAGAQRRPTAIELSATSVTFGRGPTATPALAETNLSIPDGEFLALVGPSGCGKSTILKLVSNLLRPTTGVVIVGGREVAAKALRIGMAFQNPTMLPWLTIERNIMLPLKIVEPFRSEYRQKRTGEFRDKAHALLAQVGLKDFGNKYPWQLSGGMLQRASLCRALVHDPQLLLLDEPTAGVDPKARRDFWEQIHALSDEGLTVLVSTHYMDEAERCDRIVYILNGKMVAGGTVAEVIERSGLVTFILEGKEARHLIGDFQDKPGVDYAGFFGAALHVSGRDRAALERTIAPYQDRPGLSVREEAPSLEDVFIQLQEEA
jgi:NitT/TauT family transport system ATP-binding protein